MPDILNTSLPQQKNDFVITDEIQSCIDAVLNNEKFIFITGVAGTGKSQTLKHLISVCLQNKQNVAVIAPTAVAAMNVGGQTIHSFCKLERGILDRRKIKQNSLVTAIAKKVDVLIIDEISMVRCDLFDAINACFQKNRNSHLFFGGVQLIVIGDLMQLPPIINNKIGENEALEHLGYSPRTPFFFASQSAINQDMKTIELTKVFRQNNAEFIMLLNKIRLGVVSAEEIAYINNICTKNKHIEQAKDSVIIATRNDIVQNENDKKLAEIKTPSRFYQAKITGKFKPEDAPCPTKLEIKVGAKVMFTKNGDLYINGTIGTVVELQNEAVLVEVGGNFILAKPVKWESFEYVINGDSLSKQAIGTFEQIPLTLGYAITIHKSQGKTFKKCVIDLGSGAFASGQSYVALSRCETIDGIFLRRPISKRDIIISNEVVNFFTNNCTYITESMPNTLFG